MKNLDKIYIKNLEVFSNHGVFEEENVLGQKFVVSATLYTVTRKAGEGDILSNTIHYGQVCHAIKDFMQMNTFQLIETVAEQLAKYLLIEIPNLNAITLEVKKPWAPIGLPLEYVSVEITRGWHTAYISLGSNMGDREMYLEDAVATLEGDPCCEVVQVTPWIETEPYGMLDQDPFLNGCLELRTIYDPYKLLEVLHEIENAAGRVRNVHWGPRTLDLDILLYGDRVIDSKKLIIPHVDMHNREFVLAPMSQLAPWRRHPLLHKSMKELYQELKERQAINAIAQHIAEEASEETEEE